MCFWLFLSCDADLCFSPTWIRYQLVSLVWTWTSKIIERCTYTWTTSETITMKRRKSPGSCEGNNSILREQSYVPWKQKNSERERRRKKRREKELPVANNVSIRDKYPLLSFLSSHILSLRFLPQHLSSLSVHLPVIVFFSSLSCSLSSLQM